VISVLSPTQCSKGCQLTLQKQHGEALMLKIVCLSSIVLGLMALSACSLPKGNDVDVAQTQTMSAAPTGQSGAQSQLPLPRDPQIAVQEEYDAAKSANTKSSWELFLRRHPDNDLSARARQNMAALNGKATGDQKK
jgi:hypothetical protein